MLEDFIHEYEANNGQTPIYMVDDYDGISKIVAFEEIPEESYLNAKDRLKEIRDAKNGIQKSNK